MQWSKLKARVKELICPEFRDRIDFYLTSYRESHDGADKVWITVDGQSVFSCKHYSYERAESKAYHNGLQEQQTKALLKEKEIHRPKDFGDAMRAYLDMPILDALQSSDPMIRAFALVDSRVGKRTIEKLEILDSEHSLVKAFYELRRGAMRI